MKGQTVLFNADDAIKLSGIIYKEKEGNKKILISVHGMTTNCIKKRDEIIAQEISKENMDMMVFNNRGHDIINFISKEQEKNTILAGTAYEEISECYYDILGAVKYCIENKYENIYIMGHSLGSTKTVYFYNKLLEEKKEDILKHINGILLLSLVDIPMAIRVYLKEKFATMVQYAKNMEKNNFLYELMPNESFICPISVKNFIRYAIKNEDIDFARYSDNNYDYEKINNIKVPLFMRWGNNQEMIIQKANNLCTMMQNKIKNPKKDINFIDEANHSYVGKEEILAKEIRKFIKQQ